jgi:hypothetical protein
MHSGRKTAQTVTLQHAKTICHMLQNLAVVLTEWLKKRRKTENRRKLDKVAQFGTFFSMILNSK